MWDTAVVARALCTACARAASLREWMRGEFWIRAEARANGPRVFRSGGETREVDRVGARQGGGGASSFVSARLTGAGEL